MEVKNSRHIINKSLKPGIGSPKKVCSAMSLQLPSALDGLLNAPNLTPIIYPLSSVR